MRPQPPEVVAPLLELDAIPLPAQSETVGGPSA
jgi:hypothetical protein